MKSGTRSAVVLLIGVAGMALAATVLTATHISLETGDSRIWSVPALALAIGRALVLFLVATLTVAAAFAVLPRWLFFVLAGAAWLGSFWLPDQYALAHVLFGDLAPVRSPRSLGIRLIGGTIASVLIISLVTGGHDRLRRMWVRQARY